MTQLDRLVALLADGSVWRMQALVERGFTAVAVSRAVRAGAVTRLSRGTYRAAESLSPAHSDFAVAATRCPAGVVCLLSAADFHGYGDVVPNEVWLAIPNRSRPPRMDWPTIRPVRWRAIEALTVGIDEVMITGVPVRITNPARTVVDLMRMSSAIGEDRALEGMRDYVRDGGSLNEVRSMAERFGLERSISPYINAFGCMER